MAQNDMCQLVRNITRLPVLVMAVIEDDEAPRASW